MALRLFFIQFVLVNSLFAADSFYFFSAKADIEILHNDSKESYTLHFRFKPEDSLWMSFSGSFGIEGMRMLVTKDSTYIINKLEKSTYKYSNTENNSIIPLALTIDDWRMILLNTLYTIDTSTLIQKNEEFCSYTYYCEPYTKCLLVSAEENIRKASFLNPGFKCFVTFDNFQTLIGNRNFAYTRDIEVNNEKDTWRIRINFIHHNLNKTLTLPFDYGKYNHGKNE